MSDKDCNISKYSKHCSLKFCTVVAWSNIGLTDTVTLLQSPYIEGPDSSWKCDMCLKASFVFSSCLSYTRTLDNNRTDATTSVIYVGENLPVSEFFMNSKKDWKLYRLQHAESMSAR